jgi:uncharacterized RDD family membrane protein YckC
MNDNLNNNNIETNNPVNNIINNNNVEYVINTDTPKIIGFNPNTGEPIYEGQTIEEPKIPEVINYASGGSRIKAFLSDTLLILLFSIIFYFIFSIFEIIIGMIIPETEENYIFFLLLRVLKVCIPILALYFGQPIYSMFADASKKHATRGKRKRNMSVVNKDGNNLSFGESFLRMLMKYITLVIPFGLLISIILMFVNEKHQALHDIILNQYVIQKS